MLNISCHSLAGHTHGARQSSLLKEGKALSSVGGVLILRPRWQPAARAIPTSNISGQPVPAVSMQGLLQPADLELSDARLGEIASDALVWASQHGLVSMLLCKNLRQQDITLLLRALSPV